MRPARFVTLCYCYCGVVFFAQYVVVYRFGLAFEALVQLGVALSILTAGVVRLRYPKEEEKPAEWGPFTYGMAALAVLATGILLAQLLVT